MSGWEVGTNTEDESGIKEERKSVFLLPNHQCIRVRE